MVKVAVLGSGLLGTKIAGKLTGYFDLIMISREILL
jgi:3-hydroxyacyl-CoA dehydrogenase